MSHQGPKCLAATPVSQWEVASLICLIVSDLKDSVYKGTYI